MVRFWKTVGSIVLLTVGGAFYSWRGSASYAEVALVNKEEVEEIKAELESAAKVHSEAGEKLIQSFNDAIKQIPSSTDTNFTAEYQAIEELRKLLEIMIKGSKSVEEALANYLAAAHAYQECLRKAGPAFRKLALEFSKYQEEEPFEDHKEDYNAMAEVFEAFAERTEAALLRVEEDIARVAQLSPYVHNGRVFLFRLNDAIDLIPSGDDARAYSDVNAQIEEYAALYQKLRGSLHLLRDRVRNNGTPSQPSANAPAKYSPVPPTLPDDGRLADSSFSS